MSRRLLSASMTLSLIILIGRLAGFAREVKLGAVFGLSDQADIAVILLTTPDLLVNLLLAGGIGAALIPEFTRLDNAQRSALFIWVSVTVAVVFGAIAAILAMFPSILLVVLAPAYAFGPMSEYGAAFAVTALAIPLAGLTGITTALLNAEQRFITAGAGTLVFNVTIIAAMFLDAQRIDPLLLLAMGIASAALLRYASQLAASLRHLQRSLTLHTVNVPALGRRFLATLTAVTLIQLFPIAIRSLISTSGTGNIAAFNFATKLVELPSGIVLTTISTVAFPYLSRLIASGDAEASWREFIGRAGLTVGLATSVMVPVVLFADPIAEALFGYGNMGVQEVAQIAAFTQVCMLSLPGIAATSMAIAMLNAQNRSGVLLRLTILTAFILVGLSIPGLLLDNSLFVASALPAANTVLAVILVTAVWRKRQRGGSGVAIRLLMAMVISVTLAAAARAFADILQFSNPYYDSALAGAAILSSMLVTAYLLGATREKPLGQARV